MKSFDPKERAREKQASREQDARDLEEGHKSVDALRAENGKFVFPNAKVDWESCKRLW